MKISFETRKKTSFALWIERRVRAIKVSAVYKIPRKHRNQVETRFRFTRAGRMDRFRSLIATVWLRVEFATRNLVVVVVVVNTDIRG